jgi:Pyruvate/2-oxoacid:ferredoxin oxidoreductase delta subunit
MCFDILIESLKYFLPVFTAALIWLLNERSKRKWEYFQRKEEKYKILLESLNAFYTTAQNPTTGRSDFLNQLKQCWLYCPDEVILKINKFIDSISVDVTMSDEERKRLLGESILEIRKDMISNKVARKTKLSFSDFKHYGANL